MQFFHILSEEQFLHLKKQQQNSMQQRENRLRVGNNCDISRSFRAGGWNLNVKVRLLLLSYFALAPSSGSYRRRERH